MPKLFVHGGNRIEGELTVHGAKNSALPILAATLLCETASVIDNCPLLSDVDAALHILAHLGCKIKRQGRRVEIDPSSAGKYDIPDKLMREMRSSIVFLGAIAARNGCAKVSYPGGCELGPRPIDLHLCSLSQMGMNIAEQHGFLDCKTDGGFSGTVINLPLPSVGATENILLASVTAKGITKINNAAREPEISDLAGFLNACGAKIRGAGESIIIVEGVGRLKGCEYSIIPDRIAAATYMAAAAVTGGELVLKNIVPEHLSPVFSPFKEAGCILSTQDNSLKITAPARLSRIKTVRTQVYPGFPTDALAPIMTMAAVADGTSVFIETIFQNRYKHVDELLRFGASVKVEGRIAVVEGVKNLYGAKVEATDLRGGAALVVAALAAEQNSVIEKIYHIDRGYESIEANLSLLGADIKRM